VAAPPWLLLLLQEGLLSKNNRSRIQCAEEIGCLVDREGMRVITGGVGGAHLSQAGALSLFQRRRDFERHCLFGWFIGSCCILQHGICQAQMKSMCAHPFHV
jgi:hypothetical protein